MSAVVERESRPPAGDKCARFFSFFFGAFAFTKRYSFLCYVAQRRTTTLNPNLQPARPGQTVAVTLRSPMWRG